MPFFTKFSGNIHHMYCTIASVRDLERFHDAVLNNNEDVAKELIDARYGIGPFIRHPERYLRLGPNDTLEIGRCSCRQNSCDGYTLLYMACVYDRMTIVKMLLEAGADPGTHNRNETYSTPNVQTPFVYAVKQRNQELVRMLLRKSKVHREFAEVEDGIKAIMDSESPVENPPAYNVFNLFHGAVKHRSSKLFKCLVKHFEIDSALDVVLQFGDRARSTETMSYMIEVYGARKFVDSEYLKEKIMKNGSTGIFELLMEHYYQLHGDNKALWTEQIVASLARRFQPCFFNMHCYIENQLQFSEVGKFECLLRRGMYCVLPGNRVQGESLFYLLAKAGAIGSASVLISLYPQCLQEEWLRKGRKPWNQTQMSDEEEEYFATLMEKRRHASPLQMLCRSHIFHMLGINPIPKAELLPLPRKLKDIVQAKELFETND